MTLSATGLQAALAQDTDEIFLECLTIAHADITTIRLVNDRQDLVRTAGTFVAFPFRVRLQPRSEDRIADAEIVADNVDQRIITALRGLADGATVTYEVVLEGTPNVVEAGPFEFEIMGFSADAATIAMRVSGDFRVLNEAWPSGYFAPWNAG